MSTQYGTVQPPVVITSGFLSLWLGRLAQSFVVTITHSFPPNQLNVPYGVTLEIPLNYLASIFILDHGIHGRSLRIRLISPSQAYKLDRHSTVPAHKRYMIDEAGNMQLLYHWQQNDHFDLLGILQSREFVAQIPGDLSMEALVDWGARLKDAAMVDGAVVQVLFDNLDTGRVSQLQGMPIMHQFRENSSEKWGNVALEPYDSSVSRTLSMTTPSPVDPSFGRLTPYHEQRQESPSRPERMDGEELETYRRRILRPSSPSRYYRPNPKKRRHRGGKGKGSRRMEI
jgi:hypothetical protein